MNEDEIIIKAQNGDEKAFEEIFKLYSQKAFRMVYLSTGSRYSSEDIVQEAFVKCYFELKNLKSPQTFQVWFYKMLFRIMWRYMNKEKKLVPVEKTIIEITDPENDSLFNSFEKEENSKEILKAISKLDYQHKTVLILYYYNDMPVKEIAKILGCFEGTVKSRLFNARNKLKMLLIKEELTCLSVLGKERKSYEAHGRI